MKKEIIYTGIAGLLLLGVVSANATLTTIGTATYDGNDYNLIWDDDNNGNSVVWLDYTNEKDDWLSQKNWATGLNGALTYNIDSTYGVSWDTDWRLGDGGMVSLYQPASDDGSGIERIGYNGTDNEMGHLFYEELGNIGFQANDERYAPPGWGLQNTGDFDNLLTSWYWSASDYCCGQDFLYAGSFNMSTGRRTIHSADVLLHGIALRSGQVSIAHVPEPATILLFGIGLAVFTGVNRRKKWSCG